MTTPTYRIREYPVTGRIVESDDTIDTVQTARPEPFLVSVELVLSSSDPAITVIFGENADSWVNLTENSLLSLNESLWIDTEYVTIASGRIFAAFLEDSAETFEVTDEFPVEISRETLGDAVTLTLSAGLGIEDGVHVELSPVQSRDLMQTVIHCAESSNRSPEDYPQAPKRVHPDGRQEPI